MKRLILCLVLILTLALAIPAFAKNCGPEGTDCPNGKHYNLNIVGVENDKNPDMTGSSRHTIFVDLGKNGVVKSNIYLTEGEFEVCDGNGFDPAYACQEHPGDPLVTIGRQNGATFRLPNNGCWLGDCETYSAQVYEVWVRALGTPNGNGTLTTCVETFNSVGAPVTVCSTENVILQRNAGPSKFRDYTKELTTIVLEATIYKNVGGVWVPVGTKDVRYGLFEDDFGQYLWEFDNHGLKLVQLRFYYLSAE